MQLGWGERMRIGLDGLLDPRPVGTDFILGARLDLGDDREAMTRRRSRICRAVPSLLKGKVTLLRNRQSLWFTRFVVGRHRALLDRSQAGLAGCRLSARGQRSVPAARIGFPQAFLALFRCRWG